MKIQFYDKCSPNINSQKVIRIIVKYWLLNFLVLSLCFGGIYICHLLVDYIKHDILIIFDIVIITILFSQLILNLKNIYRGPYSWHCYSNQFNTISLNAYPQILKMIDGLKKNIGLTSSVEVILVEAKNKDNKRYVFETIAQSINIGLTRLPLNSRL